MAPVAIPNNYPEVIQIYGNIHQFIRDDGTLSPQWESDKITRVMLPAPLPLGSAQGQLVSRVTAHVLIADEVNRLFTEIYNAGLWQSLRTYDGGFNFRPIRGVANRLSMHSFGIAYDLDASENPLGSTTPHMNTDVIAIFRKYGWLWGGDYQGRKDPMHFQRAHGC